MSEPQLLHLNSATLPAQEFRAGMKSSDHVNYGETADPLTVEWLRDPSELERHADEWRALERSASHTHLSSFDFIAPWYMHYAGSYGGTPLIGLARRRSRLVGVAPM